MSIDILTAIGWMFVIALYGIWAFTIGFMAGYNRRESNTND